MSPTFRVGHRPLSVNIWESIFNFFLLDRVVERCMKRDRGKCPCVCNGQDWVWPSLGAQNPIHITLLQRNQFVEPAAPPPSRVCTSRKWGSEARLDLGISLFPVHVAVVSKSLQTPQAAPFLVMKLLAFVTCTWQIAPCHIPSRCAFFVGVMLL